MRPERPLIAARPLARHSAALLRPAPAAAELLPQLARAGDHLARKLRLALAPVHGGEVATVKCSAPALMTAADFAPSGLVSISLLGAITDGQPMLSVVEGDTVLRLLDRAFGGPGEAPYPLPRELPLSAELMVQRIDMLVAPSLAAALGLEGPIQVLRRAASLADLAAVAEDASLAVLNVSIREGARPAWTLRLGFPMAALASLAGPARTAGKPALRAEPASPLDQPFADMPLTLRAVLVDVPLPLATLSGLRVGQILAVPVARNVPLRIHDTLVGHGTIGAVDDRVALQLTQLA
jgi:flagellar motor switch protein FliM